MAVKKTLKEYVTNLQCKPPYHPDGLVPMSYVGPIFQAIPPQPIEL